MSIICLPETYLDSTVLLDNDNLEISRYILNRCDHPLITKRGAVCLYCKNCLPQRVLNISYFKECLNFKLKDRLSSLKTWHFLNVFGLFSPLKKTIQFPFMFNLYFQQKRPSSCQFFITWQKDPPELMTLQPSRRNEFCLFFNVVIR